MRHPLEPQPATLLAGPAHRLLLYRSKSQCAAPSRCEGGLVIRPGMPGRKSPVIRVGRVRRDDRIRSFMLRFLGEMRLSALVGSELELR